MASARRWLWLLLVLPVLGGGSLLLHAQIEGDRGIAPLASSGDYEVSGIRVDTPGKTSLDARTNGWRMAQRLGWQKLWTQMNRGGKAPALSDSDLDAIVSAIVVEDEENGPRRYIARLGVLFDRARAGQILGIEGSHLRSAPMLVIPILWSGGSPQVFENRTPWQAAWARYRTADSAIDYVRPSGSGAESLLVNAAQTGRRSRTWWRLILDQFGAADVIIPVAEIERPWPGGPVIGRFTARFGPDNRMLGSFTLRARSGEGLEQMFDTAVRRFDALYTRTLREGGLVPDASLIIERPVEPDDSLLDESLAEVPVVESGIGAEPGAGQQVIAVQFTTPDAAAVSAGERALRGIPGVQSAATSSLALGGVSVMRVVYAGDLAALAAALQARGWQVQQGSGALRISRPGDPPGDG